MLMHGKTFADFPQLDQAAGAMLDELLWWAEALQVKRDAAA
jgi:hypothetical protein